MQLLNKLRLIRSVLKPGLLKGYASKMLEEKLNKEGKEIFISADYQVIDSVFEKNNRLFGPGKIAHSHLGSFTYLQSNTNIAHCKMGRYCSVGPNTLIANGIHPTDFISSHPLFYSEFPFWPEAGFSNEKIIEQHKEVIIGHDVWIGANCYLNDGLTIGTGSIIAAGSIVVKDVPPYAIVGGVPAKVIRFRFSESVISKLMESKWWELDLTQLKKVESFFKKPLNELDADLFLKTLNRQSTE